MRKITLNLLLGTLGMIFLGSCGSIQDVVNGNSFAKRKYTAGIFKRKSVGVNPVQHDNKLAQISSVTESPVNVGVDSNDEETKPFQSINAELTAKSEINNHHAKDNIKKSEVAVSSINKKKQNAATTFADKSTNERNGFVSVPFFKCESNTARAPYGQENTAVKTDPVIEVILAIFLPAIGVYVHEGVTTDFWISLILWVFIITWFLASIFAVLVVLDIISLG